MTAFEPPAPSADDARAESDPATPIRPATGPSSTGSSSPVAAALTRLDGVHELPLHEQPDVYQAVHADLQHALAAIDDA